jgi:hypothetical protein
MHPSQSTVPPRSLLATKIQDKITGGIDFRDMSAAYTPYKVRPCTAIYRESSGR